MGSLARLACILALGAALQSAPAKELPRPEHPRPDMLRETWQNLNGEWQFAFDPKDKGLEEDWHTRDSLPRTITVPYPVESELSGIHELDPPEVCWYLKRFDLGHKLDWRGPGPKSRLLLRFGAVDYHATVWLNNIKLGRHTGGYTPFTFDVTDAVRPTDNILVVRVFDSLDRMQVRGKQSPSGEPHMIMYETVTGIWQTVWIEKTGDPYIKGFRFTPAKGLSGGKFKLNLSRQDPEARPQITVISPDGKEELGSRVSWRGLTAKWHNEITQPWSPDYPALYTVKLALLDKDDQVIDRVSSYVGVRAIETRGDEIFLNGQRFYQKLLLDQGYFPGGIYTPEKDGIMREDIEMYRRMGFNGLRKHQKIEDPRFLYWCDRLGLVVWEEMPSLGFGRPRGVPEWAMQSFEKEWREAIRRDYNHPSIIAWTVFNESWGVYGMVWSNKIRDWAHEMVQLTREEAPSRLVVDNSGGYHFDTDVWDFHHYLSTAEKSRWLYQKYDFDKGDRLGTGWYLMSLIRGKPVLPIFAPGARYEGQPVVLSEYGGFGFYRTEGEKGLLELYRDYTLAIKDYPYIKGYCYTQPYDVQQEKNGLMTFERKPKVGPEKIRQINRMMGEE